MASSSAKFACLAWLVAVLPAQAGTTIFRNGFEFIPCQGLECFQVECQAGTPTRITGRVFAPNGTLPLPNVEVYVPNADLAPLPDGVQCARCDIPPSGSPLVRTRSGADGSFVLEDAPATSNVPIVIQSGKWRSKLIVPSVAACQATSVVDGTLRFARTASEGDMPKIAVSTGAADAQECLLRKAGIADSEFTPMGGSGRVHLYAGSGGTDAIDAANGGEALAPATSLWGTLAQLSSYDLVLLGCEATQVAATKPLSSLMAMKDYADIGGRVLMVHWHNIWLQSGPAPWPELATWSARSGLQNTQFTIATGFPRGDEFAQWVVAAGASATPGILQYDGAHMLDTVDTTRVRKRLFKDVTPSGFPTVQYFSFTTPVEDPPNQRCGRVAFSAMHGVAGDSSGASLAFPSGGCVTPVGQLAPQEKAAIYMMFDLTGCVDDVSE